MKRIYYDEDVRAAAKELSAHLGTRWARDVEECLALLDERWEVVVLAGRWSFTVAEDMANGKFPHLREAAIVVKPHVRDHETKIIEVLEDAGFGVSCR